MTIHIDYNTAYTEHFANAIKAYIKQENALPSVGKYVHIWVKGVTESARIADIKYSNDEEVRVKLTNAVF